MKGKNPSSLTVVSQPQDYFRELVTNALEKQKLNVQPETEFYLVNLLFEFMKSDRLYQKDSEGNRREEPLALMIKEAMEHPRCDAQRQLFRYVGDLSLYKAGYFQESFNRKLVDVDYYIGMGGAAYSQVSTLAEENMLRALYAELAEKFSSFVDVLAEISDMTTQKNSEADLLRLYDLWVKTRSERAERALKEAGIHPNLTLKKTIQ